MVLYGANRISSTQRWFAGRMWKSCSDMPTIVTSKEFRSKAYDNNLREYNFSLILTSINNKPRKNFSILLTIGDDYEHHGAKGLRLGVACRQSAKDTTLPSFQDWYLPYEAAQDGGICVHSNVFWMGENSQLEESRFSIPSFACQYSCHHADGPQTNFASSRRVIRCIQEASEERRRL